MLLSDDLYSFPSKSVLDDHPAALMMIRVSEHALLVPTGQLRLPLVYPDTGWVRPKIIASSMNAKGDTKA